MSGNKISLKNWEWLELMHKKLKPDKITYREIWQVCSKLCRV